ncbi:Macrolide export ATP-binding/permease protein MacB [Megamonas hypermegale]|uniref:Macrolide export ATP-binding/permease protein MacB n=1 Tax=Megamonas hypermegale TaxID=158847 RepID=A0A239TAU4_9FIRM|nr:ABC transporter ATP-binding protein [Megamonas hypermegale]MBM6760664.1 ABC transporter ATP-binding protein [Megamonas hypermegale]SNU93973.1 Macrolide export ATP-binding/permease protein MacB [Megamonas hypermegale]
MDFKEFVQTHTIGEIKKAYPQVIDYLDNTGLWNLPDNLTFAKAFEDIDEEDLWQVGIKGDNIADELTKFIAAMQDIDVHDENKIENITILGGVNKQGEAENIKLLINTGEIISIVGPTGSGKSRLLADIECLAQADTPTKRTILINRKELDDEARFNFDGKLVAQLSQNMNFIMDVSVEDFLTMHAKVRMGRNCDFAEVVNRCFAMANELAGEKFTLDTKVTQLSGGQSRALMIADVACISSSPIVLIDEIENAGIDRQQAVKVLAKSEKIVIMSTHDPLLALSADKRIVIKNGGIAKIIETTQQERDCIDQIRKLDNILLDIRRRLRMGELIENI